MTALPSLAEIQQLPELVRQVAGPEWEDGNGHVNVRHFYDLHMRAATVALRQVGFDEGYREERGLSVFSVEQHLRYYGEVRIGEEVAAYLRWLGRGSKVFHAISVVVNLSTGQVANTVELLEAHVDLTARRAAAMPADLAGAIDEAVAAHAALPWQLPVTGHMRVRPPA